MLRGILLVKERINFKIFCWWFSTFFLLNILNLFINIMYFFMKITYIMPWFLFTYRLYFSLMIWRKQIDSWRYRMVQIKVYDRVCSLNQLWYFGYNSVLLWVRLCTTNIQVVIQKPLTVLYCNCVRPKWYTMSR